MLTSPLIDTPKHTLCLFEVGTEELPAGFLQGVVAQWETALLAQAEGCHVRLSAEDFSFFITPRRLAVRIKLPHHTEAQTIIYKGPSVKIGLDTQGQPTPALLGFCKKWDITPEVLSQVEDKGQQVFQYTQTLPTQPIADVLPQLLTQSVAQLTGSHFMKWEEAGEFRFSRPIRWLVCLLNHEVIPFDWAGLTTNRLSYGHRVHATQTPIVLQDATSYETQLLEEGRVMVSPSTRQAKIQHQLTQEAQKLGGAIYTGDLESLSETLVHLSETPEVVVGTFEEAFLKLPATVLNTVLKSHQKCLLFRTADAPYAPALPYFATVANGVKNETARQLIAEGNAKVVRSRFADALFFYQEDVAKALHTHAEGLQQVVFQRGLGTLADKAQGLQAVCDWLVTQKLLPASLLNQAKTTIPLLKADLVTQMVFEFPELQGEVGEAYALAQGHDVLTAQSILDHYLPRFPNDIMPRTFLGQVLGIIDRLDTLLAVFSQPKFKAPTGSRDPLGLRRLVAGLLQLLQFQTWQNDTTIDAEIASCIRMWQTTSLDTLFAMLYEGLPFVQKRPWTEVKPELASFYEARLLSFVETLEDVTPALPYITLAQEGPYAGHSFLHPYALRDYACALSTQTLTWQSNPACDTLREAMTRTENILQKEPFTPQSSPQTIPLQTLLSTIDPEAFEKPSEATLYQTLQGAISATTWQETSEVLMTLAPQIHALFEEVMIFAEAPAVAHNRLTLLGAVRLLARRIAGKAYWSTLSQHQLAEVV